MEIWKDIEGYENKYEVSSYGQVRSVEREYTSIGGKKVHKKGRILKQFSDKRNYKRVALCANGVCKQKAVHRLVAMAFLNSEKDKPEVNHKDGNPSNNNADNLEWCSRSENILHSYRKLGREWNAGRPRVKVICIETGESFNSIVDAARSKGLDVRNVHSAIYAKNGRRTCGGFHWKKDEREGIEVNI